MRATSKQTRAGCLKCMRGIKADLACQGVGYEEDKEEKEGGVIEVTEERTHRALKEAVEATDMISL